ncbi:Chitinase 2, partial [Coemansia spiralis]
RAAGNGYLDLSTLQSDIGRLYANYTSTFGGIMLWDASWYTNNQDYVQQLSRWVKAHMVSDTAAMSTRTSTRR